MPGVVTATTRPSPNRGDHKNIIATTTVDPCPATTPPAASIRSDTPQGINLPHISTVPTRRHLASLSRSGVFRARTRTRSWRDRDVQQPKSFVWSPTRPANRPWHHPRTLHRRDSHECFASRTARLPTDGLPERFSGRKSVRAWSYSWTFPLPAWHAAIHCIAEVESSNIATRFAKPRKALRAALKGLRPS